MANEMQKPVLEGKGATDYERYLRTDESAFAADGH